MTLLSAHNPPKPGHTERKPRTTGAARTVAHPIPNRNSGARKPGRGMEHIPKLPPLACRLPSPLCRPLPPRGAPRGCFGGGTALGVGSALSSCFYLIKRGLSGKTSRKGKTIARPQPRLARRRPARPRAPTAGILPAGTCPAPLPRL